MSTKPPQGLNAAFEDDPTGVRELLRGLPDPGAMPADVTDRIRDALAAESAARMPGRLHAVPLHAAPLEDADPTGMRDLLRSQPDPGPMPERVSASILSALSAESVDRSAGFASDAASDDAAFDDDTTGMRDLLRSQPDPGPMPEHLSALISKRLVAERIIAADEDPTGMRELLRSQPDPGPMPDLVAARVTAALRHEAERRDDQPSNVTALRSRPGNAPARSGRMLRLVGGAVAAAVAGVIAIGTFQSMGNDAPPTQAVNSKTPGASNVADKVYVTSTDTNYTAASLPSEAGSLARKDVDAGLTPADASKLGSVATKDGAMACASAIGQEILDKSSRITVDIARYEGTPALVVVVTKDGTSTAWVLNRNCDQTQTPLAGPTRTT